MKKPWNIGLVGVGNRAHGYTHHPQVKVTALCDVDPHALQQMQGVYGLQDNALHQNYEHFLNADIDIVIICTPIAFHAQQAIDALKAGKHVLSEVTAALTIEDGIRLLAAVEQSDNVYMLAENYIYFHYIRQWKTWVDKGHLGKLFHAEAEYIHEIKHLLQHPETGEKYWRYTRPPIYYCTHTLGPILHLFGNDRIVRATGLGKSQLNNPDGGEGFIDMQVALFETAQGRSIKIVRSQTAPRHPEVVHYSLYGTKGFVENGKTGYTSNGLLYLDGEPGYETGARAMTFDVSDPHAPQGARRGGHGTSEYYLFQDFLAAIEAGKPNPIDIYRGLEMTLPGIIAHEAIKKGGVWLEVPDVR